MRWYDIKITKPGGGIYIPPSSTGGPVQGINGPTTWTSYSNGKNNPAAQNVEWSIPASSFATPRQGANLKIWGIGSQDVAQAFDLNLSTIEIRAGYQKGLPLNKPAQAGLIARGLIFQPYGAWQMENQFLAMNILPVVPQDPNTPPNLMFNCAKGASIATSIQNSLQTAYASSGYTIAPPALSANLVASEPLLGGPYPSLVAFAGAMNAISLQSQYKGAKPLGGGTYTGIQIVIRGTQITTFDGTQNTGGAGSFGSPTQIALEDIIGQPTWMGPQTMQVKCPMRADIGIGNYLKMPTTLTAPYVLTTPGASLPNTAATNTKAAFQGTFNAIEIYHWCNFRQEDSDSFATTINAVSGFTAGQ